MGSSPVKLQHFPELFLGDSGLPQNSAKGSLINFPVHGHHAYSALAPQDKVTASLSAPHETQPFQSPRDLLTGDARQLRHDRPRTW